MGLELRNGPADTGRVLAFQLGRSRKTASVHHHQEGFSRLKFIEIVAHGAMV